MVDNVLHSRKDLQLVEGQVTAIKPKKTAKQVKVDKIGKAAYVYELKDLTDSSPSLKKVEQMINTPVQTRASKRKSPGDAVVRFRRARRRFGSGGPAVQFRLFGCSVVRLRLFGGSIVSCTQ
jgi:hypothetical protein